MTDLFDPMTFTRGPAMRNRFMLAPLTNKQSHPDGTLSEAEFNWLTMRAKGGFGLVMTAATFVQMQGKAFKGQLGIHDDACLPGLSRLADAIRAEGSLSAVQLHHGGIRADVNETGLEVLGPSDDPKTGARAMTPGEIEQTIQAFIDAARRAEKAGFDGVELHGAHTYLLCAFLSGKFNRRSDDFGGSLENRARLIREVIAGIRRECRSDFTLGLRLSAERMGMEMAEVRTLSGELMAEGQLDYLDLSLWDCFKDPEEEEFKGKPLISHFTDIDRHGTRLGAAGNLRSGSSAQACLDAGADFVLIGKAAIANHDFPEQVRKLQDFAMQDDPLSREHLAAEGISPVFVDYLETFPGLVEPA